MIVKGVIELTYDFNKFMYLSQKDPNLKCIFVGEYTNKYDDLFNSYGVIPASILMPDYICMESQVNGTPDEFKEKYFAYLSSEEPKSMIITLIAALYQSKNIVILVPPEAVSMQYPMVLMDYLFSVHGIQTIYEPAKIKYGYNQQFDLYNADCLYSLNIIGPAEYLKVAGPQFDMIDKLCYDTQMKFGQNFTAQMVKDYFEQWRQSMIRSGMITTKPIGFMHT